MAIARPRAALSVALISAAFLCAPTTPAMSDDNAKSSDRPVQTDKKSDTKSLLKGRYNALQDQLETVKRQMKSLSNELKRPTRSGTKKLTVPKQKKSAKKTAQSPAKKMQMLRKRADKAFLDGNYAEAEKDYRAILKTKPVPKQARHAHMRLAEIYFSRGDKKKALQQFSKAEAIKATNPIQPRRPKAAPPVKRTTAKERHVKLRPLKAEMMPSWNAAKPAPKVSPAEREDTSEIGYLMSPRKQMKSGERLEPGSREEFIVKVGDRVFFASDETKLDARAKSIVHRQADWLKRHKHFVITIEGHADERGTREYNIAIGSKRAQSLRSYFVSQGLLPSRLRIISYGKERPVALCDNIRCWAQNRRAIVRLSGKSRKNNEGPETSEKAPPRTVWRLDGVQKAKAQVSSTTIHPNFHQVAESR